MKKNLLEIINQVLYDSGSKIDTLNPEMDLRNDLGMDSMNLAYLTVLIEDEYGVDIFAEGLTSKVSQILNKING
jgi:acyl carrier protein